jgi:sugar (pentulose or hexulose) kinase
MNHILVLDIGKTNKKCFVFDEDYQVVFEQTTTLPETFDEDGFPCEDLNQLKQWVETSVSVMTNDPRFHIRAMHCTTYGASFVHLDANSQPLTPLYNYLKPFPPDLKKQFFDTFGGETKMALETASPVLGMLNSGLQLYWLKYHQPLLFDQIQWSLHLPQYIAFLLGGSLHIPSSEMTSIGCHTMLWDFQKNDYHEWVKIENIADKFFKSDTDTPTTVLGLHDSSAALIPYLATFHEPFILISTGTWCISLNPFNEQPLTPEALLNDCLCYLTMEGKPVKAARYFGGNEHDESVKNIAAAFGVDEHFYKSIKSEHLSGIEKEDNPAIVAYIKFMRQLIEKQVISTRWAIGNTSIQRIFIDGGFSQNEIYMTLLAQAFPTMEVYAATVAQATALGAAIAVHQHWNTKPIPTNLIDLKKVRV